MSVMGDHEQRLRVTQLGKGTYQRVDLSQRESQLVVCSTCDLSMNSGVVLGKFAAMSFFERIGNGMNAQNNDEHSTTKMHDILFSYVVVWT